MRRILVRSVAEAELAEAYFWYVRRSPQAAQQLLDEFEKIVLALGENPLQFPEVRAHLRRARMRVFPYGVYFTVIGDVVSVVGVVHARQHPHRWTGRSDIKPTDV